MSGRVVADVATADAEVAAAVVPVPEAVLVMESILVKAVVARLCKQKQQQRL